MEAKTIHRLLEINPATRRFSKDESNPLDCGLLVVDETSMVDVLLMHSMVRALPNNAGLVLVGDVNQLPSVGPGTVLQDLIESGVVPVVRLSEVFREAAESRIITNAHRIRRGQMPEMHGAEPSSDFHFVERDEPEQIVATLVNLVQERIPEGFGLDPIRDVQVLCPMNRGSLGVRELNTALQRVLNPPRPGEPSVERFGWRFQMGDKLIQTENVCSSLRGDDPQVTGIAVCGSCDPAGHPALHAAPAQPNLYRGHAGHEAGGGGGAEEALGIAVPTTVRRGGTRGCLPVCEMARALPQLEEENRRPSGRGDMVR
jgi:exodeoxyribonuclease V alpha subunit